MTAEYIGGQTQASMLSAAKFLKSEFVISAVIAMLVVAFVHASARRRARNEPLATDPPPNLFKVFAVALCASYLIMYLLVGQQQHGGDGPVSPPSRRAPLAGGSGIESALKEAMRYIDAGEPDF